jgi:hypothetical protein
MSVKIKKHVKTSYSVSSSEFPDTTFEVSFEPVDLYQKEPVIIRKINDNLAVVGYLSRDDTPQDPTEWDGNGHIYTSNRWASDHDKMQSALGLNSSWEPDLELVDIQLVDDRYIEYFCANTEVEDLIEHYERGTERELELTSGPSDADMAYKIYCAEEDLRCNASWNLKYADVYEDIQKTMWEEGRADGTIGNPHAVLLDVYDHGGQSFSISGQGMQCRWDTARGAAVWVPTDSDVENIHQQVLKALNTEVVVIQTACVGGDNRPWVLQCVDRTFSNWKDATAYGISLIKHLPEFKPALSEALHDYAASCLETYNQYLCGDVYGVCVAVCELETGVEVESDECWGFYGSDYAYKELEASVRSKLEHSLKESA